MATLKVFDGTAWQVVAGQGSPGQGVPAGGAVNTLLVKNSGAHFDTGWTSDVTATAGNLTVNAAPNTGAAVNVQPPAGGYPALDAWARYGSSQTQAILRVVDSTGQVPWFVDRYGRPKPFVQAGSTVATTDGNGIFTVTFPEPFLTVPVVVCTEAGNNWANTSILYVATNVFNAHIRTPTGAAWPNALHRLNWFAYETRTP